MFHIIWAHRWVCATLFVVAGCGPDEGDPKSDRDTPSEDDTLPEDDTDSDDLPDVPPAGRFELTLDPSLDRRMTSPEATLAMAGRVIDLDGVGPPAQLEWRVTHQGGASASGDGAVDGDGAWTAVVTLAPGDNLVSLSVPGTAADLQVMLVHNPDFAFGGSLELDRTVAYVDEGREVVAAIILTDPDPSGVTIVQVLADGSEVPVGTMVDDGDVAQRDNVAGDDVYHGLFQVLASAPGRVRYRVVVERPGGGVARTELRDVVVAEHIDPTRFEAQVAAGVAFQERLDAAATEQEQLAVLAVIHDELAVDPSVVQVDYNDSGRGIWLVYDNGVAAVIDRPVAGEKGGGGGRASGRGVASSPLGGAAAPSGRASAGSRPAGPGENDVNSARARVIAAQYWDWGEDDDIPVMEQALIDHGCFQVSSDFDTVEGGGTVEHFKNLGDYGVVLISTHGDSFFHGLLTLWTERWGWDGPFGEVILHTNHVASVANLPIYEDDLVAGRLLLWYGMYGITPSFVRHYSGSMPKSLVYVSACRGTWNATLASAFLESGAGAFLGYSDYVAVDFTRSVGIPFLDDLLAPEATVADAFVAAQVESNADPAEFRLFGESSLGFDIDRIHDGGFESGDLHGVWGGGLGASTVPSLLGSTPTEGRWMALVSSGLGDTFPATISQTFCLDGDDATLSFDWNFFSEDRHTGPDPDHFRVSIQAETASPPYFAYETLLYESVDSLRDDLTELTGASFSPGCTTCLETTGWRSASFPIPADMLGGRVTMILAVSQEGGGETAVLVDDIRLTP